MQERPKLKLTLLPLDKSLEAVGKLFLLLMWCIAFVVYIKSPKIIPIHFDGVGKANSYGEKITLFLLPILATVLYAGISYLSKFPHIFNYMVKITEANAALQYSYAVRLLRYIKLAIVVIFTIIILSVYLVTNGIMHELGWWFLPFVLLLFLLPTAIYIAKTFKK